MLTFAHIFKSCSQDSCAVLAVMADVIWQLKIAMPGLEPSVIGRIMPAATTAEPLSSVQQPLAMKKVSRSGV